MDIWFLIVVDFYRETSSFCKNHIYRLYCLSCFRVSIILLLFMCYYFNQWHFFSYFVWLLPPDIENNLKPIRFQLIVFIICHKPRINIKQPKQVIYLFIKLCCFVTDCTRRFLLFASHNQSPSQESLMPRFAWSLPSPLGRAIPPPALPIGKPSLWRTQCVAPSLANFGQRLLIRTHQQRHHCQDDQQW